jgi:hypothetical protein
MGTITLTDPITGNVISAGLLATNFGNLRALLNGGIDGVNLRGSPSLIAGEAPIWNGTQFDRSSVTRLLANGNVKFDGYGTSLPGSPYDGQVFTLVDSGGGTTYQWTFRYNAGSASANKWEFIGGTPARTASGSGTFATTTPTALTAGAQFTIPRAGEYTINFGARMQATPFTSLADMFIQMYVTAGPTALGNPAIVTATALNVSASVTGFALPTNLSAGNVIEMRAWVNPANATNSLGFPWFTVLPHRVA